MPLTAQLLESKLIDEIAPGNPELFYQRLSEADELLLYAGKWRWVRKAMLLLPENGVIVLPDGYESIVGARLGSQARGVAWEETEFFEDGPGLIPIQNGSGRLVDQGLLSIADGKILFNLTEFDFDATMLPSLMIGGFPSWSSNGKSAIPQSDQWARIFLDAGSWTFELYEDGGIIAKFTAATAGGLTPIGLEFEPDTPGIGELEIEASMSLKRCYKVTEALTEEVTVLARYEASQITLPTDIPRCPSFSALKRAMLSLIYESNGDLAQSVNYFQAAKIALDEQEAAYRGSAKQVFKPAMFGPLRRHTNFR